MYEKELFANYEFDSSNWNKVILGLLGGSAIFHVIILLFLVYVPAVRDAFYVAMLFSDAPTGWVSKDYQKTAIGEETVSIISLPPADQLQYPAGYFNLANGDAPAPDLIASTTPVVPETIPTDPNSIPGFPGLTLDQQGFTPNSSSIPPEFSNPVSSTSPTNRKTPRKVKLPRLPQTVPGATPPPLELSNSNTGNEPNNDATGAVTPSPTPLPNPDKPDSTRNPKPLIDYGKKVAKLREEKKLDLEKPFHVVIDGKLKEGKLIEAKTTPISGDLMLNSLATELIAALNDSNVLSALKQLCVDTDKGCRLSFDIKSDKDQVKAQILTDTDSNSKAGMVSLGLQAAIGIALNERKDKVEGKVLQFVTVKPQDKSVIIDCVMPRSIVESLVKEQLDAAIAKQLGT